MFPSLRSKFLVLILACAAGGCTSGSGALLQTMQRVVDSGVSADGTRLDERFRYLRVTVDGRIVYLALGYVDRGPRGPVEVWYSAEREVIRLQNGRLVGAAGLATEWLSVALPELPSWSDLARREGEFRWRRVRDVMPGYQFGHQDDLVLRVIHAPEKTALRDLDPRSLTWFEESFERPASSGWLAFPGKSDDASTLPPARYAADLGIGTGIVVYGEQCVARNLCFTWQRWSVQPQKK